MSRCIIISNGIITDYSFYKCNFKNDDYVICADGGIKHLLELNRTPDLWLGDFDSCKFNEICNKHIELNDVEKITLNPVKDVTDTHYACLEAVKRNYKDIVIWGACGGRLDHMLSNIHLLELLYKNNIKAKIQDDKNTIHICGNEIKLLKKHKYISIIPLDNTAVISKTTGLKYPLQNFALNREISLGISNEIIGSEAYIKIESGLVLVIESDD